MNDKSFENHMKKYNFGYLTHNQRIEMWNIAEDLWKLSKEQTSKEYMGVISDILEILVNNKKGSYRGENSGSIAAEAIHYIREFQHKQKGRYKCLKLKR